MEEQSQQPVIKEAKATPGWSLAGMITMEPDSSSRYLGWWHRLLAVPNPPPESAFVLREEAARAKLFSTILFYFFMAPALALIPCFFLPSKLFLITALLAILACVIGGVLGRFQRWQLAALFVIFGFNFVVMFVVINTQPRDASSIQHYDVFVFAEVVAVSLVKMRWVIVLLLINLLFLSLDMAFSPYTADLAPMMTGFYLGTMIIRPVAVQVVAVTAVSLWMSQAKKATKRADRAEMVATLEHRIAQQQIQAEQEKQELEENIHRIVQDHVDAANNQVFSRIPYPDLKILWPLIGVINSLRTRLLHEQEVEKKYQELNSAVENLDAILRDASEAPEKPLPRIATKTSVDLLFPSLHKFYHGVHGYWRSQMSRR